MFGVLNLGGAASNATFGFPSPEEQKEDYSIVVDAVNRAGGAACRKLVATFIEANLADPNAEQKACLDATSAHALVLINGNRNSNACYYRAKLAVLNGLGGGRVAEMKEFYPYVFSVMSQDAIARNGVLAMKSMGLLSAGTGKLGLASTSCHGEQNAAFEALLRQAGVASSQLVTYDFGCPSGFVPPQDLQQAILKFKTSGVDRVIPFELVASFANFTRQARTQDFKPKYLIANTDGTLENSYGPLAPDAENVDGSIGFSSSAVGEEHTPGYAPSPGTKKCSAIFAAAGRPPVYQQPVGYGGSACTQVWIVAGMIDRAPTLATTDLVRGLQAALAAGDILSSYPMGPVANAPPGTFAGGQHWRPVQFSAACKCWKLMKNDWQPSFP